MSSGDTKFRQLLVELNPPMTAASTWVQVKRAVSTLPSAHLYRSLPTPAKLFSALPVHSKNNCCQQWSWCTWVVSVAPARICSGAQLHSSSQVSCASSQRQSQSYRNTGMTGAHARMHMQTLALPALRASDHAALLPLMHLTCRRQAWVDSRFDAVSEERRRELFEMYKAMLAEEAEATPQQHSRAQVWICKVHCFPYSSHLSEIAGGRGGGHPAAQHGQGLPNLLKHTSVRTGHTLFAGRGGRDLSGLRPPCSSTAW